MIDLYNTQAECVSSLVADLGEAAECDAVLCVDVGLWAFVDDTHQCETCDVHVSDQNFLDDNGDCDVCAAEHTEMRENMRMLRSDYQHAVL